MATYPERTNYFLGQVLGVDDFRREQDYLIARLRRHNRLVLGWGVASGLGVTVSGSTVHVDAGLAIDCEGNEVELIERVSVDLSSAPSPCFVGVAFTEIPRSPVATTSGVHYGVTREAAEVIVAPVNACAGHARMGPGSPGCGLRHAVVVARLVKLRGTWRVRATRCRNVG
jgi:hypothetical protein